MADDLEERLNGYAESFEGLMSLIPAKQYYGEDTSDQWQRKKQTKEQRQNAKRAKLDPASHKSAKDVMDENERKRKRVMDGESGSDIDLEGIAQETPFEGLKSSTKKAKKQKLGHEAKDERRAEKQAGIDGEAANRKAKAEKKKAKQQMKKEKLEKQQQKAEAKKARKGDAARGDIAPDSLADEQDTDDVLADEHADERIQRLDVSGLVDNSNSEDASTATPTPAPESPLSPASAILSGASSSSSIVPPSTTDNTDKSERLANPKKVSTLSSEEKEAMKARLQAKIDEMRARRKADGPDGRPARNRAELIEARRKKEEQRRAAKKTSRQLAKDDELRIKAEAELARLRGSGSPMSMSGILTPRSLEPEHNFSFGRVAWGDGQQMDSGLSGFINSQKKKGPSDPRTALEAAQKKRAQINGLDEGKRADIEEKDSWLNAKKRVHGEKVRDDTSLLKKTLKRKEKTKHKSEKEWNDRIAGVEKGKEMKQKKREANLKKRKEEKGGKGKKKPAKKVKRPGFEGTFKSR